MDLYDEVFRPVGVSMMQYERLMSFANKCKARTLFRVVCGKTTRKTVSVLNRLDLLDWDGLADSRRLWSFS